MIALVRMSALSTMHGEDVLAKVDLSNDEIVRALRRDFGRFKRDAAERTGESERAAWLHVQIENYNRTTQRMMRELLLERELLLDRKRVVLPVGDESIKDSLRQVYNEDAAAVVNLWRNTRGTNHIKILRDIVQAYRGEEGAKPYADVPGLCEVATVEEIAAQGWSLNPGRYVGVAERAADDFEFTVRLEELNEELETLNAEAHELEDRIAENVRLLLEPEKGTNAEKIAASVEAKSFSSNSPHFTREELHERG